jgi:3-hydroxyacyl-CoA dehydrogenase/enoyl-CoA hydratase/3-hydroxybutyryl-CoA epimerase
VTIASPGRSVNTLGTNGLEDLEALVAWLESERTLRGVVLASAQPRTFLAGADLDEVAGLADPGLARAWVERGQAVLDRFRRLPLPTVAAVRGAALGGGLEVAMACGRRIAADDRATSLGLPELQLGLLPALGGTYDLPRLVGLPRGLDMLLTGRRLDARRALAWGLVDEVVPESLLLRVAFERLERPPGGAARGWLGRSFLGRSSVLAAARRRAEVRTRGRYPAVPAVFAAVEAGLRGGRAAAQRVEAESFGVLAASPVAKNLIALFLRSRQLGGAAGIAPWSGDSRSLGILGAGFMGSGIAAEALRHEFRVRLLDQRPEALGKALAQCARRMSRGGRRRGGSPGGLTATLEPWGFGRSAIVVEAIVEEPAAKRALLEAVEPQLSPGAILASNTSTLPIASLAQGLRHPNRFLGLHFFSPVEKMPLVEVVRHPGTAEVFVDRARAFVAALGKTPIVVRDGPGFYTTRILTPYLAQAVELLREGWSIAEIDAAGREAGFPVGPLELLDEVGIDVAANAARTMAEAFPERMPLPREWKRLLEAGRFGRKRGQGFYDYKGKTKRPDTEIRDVLEIAARARGRARPENGERLLYAMAAEAVRCLEDGILERPADGDVGAVLGLGFPPHLGGPFRWLDAIGAPVAVDRLRKLAAARGPVFAVPELLADLAARQVSFAQLDARSPAG